MIPYFTVPRIHLFGPVAIEPFGLLVFAGILAGIWFAHRRAKQAGIPKDEIAGAVKWALAGGLLGAHIYYVLVIQPEQLKERGPFALLEFWNGMSSFGGFMGALAGVASYFALLKKRWLRHADILVQALVAGWIFGRLGCTIAHDHIGRESTFFLAFSYPGGSCHNLGFYELLFTLFVILPTILLIHRASARPGIYVVVVSLLYAPFRFLLEFLRDGGSRQFGLNLEQFSSIGLLCLGIWIYLQQEGKSKKRSRFNEKALSSLLFYFAFPWGEMFFRI